MDRVDKVVEILLDKEARIDERDDAAMLLREFNDDRALEALVKVATDAQEEEFIMYACGESIAEIWVTRDAFDAELYLRLNPSAQREAYMCIKKKKPQWISDFNLQ